MSPPPSNSLATPVALASEKSDANAWFTAQVQPHESHLRNYLRGSFPKARDLDDIVQESFLLVWKAKAVHPIQSAKAFLFKVARNVALDLLRRQTRSPICGVTDLADLNVLDSRPGVADLASAREEAALLAEAIHALPARCREIVILRKLKQVPQKEIARQLAISEETVSNQVFRGVRRCEQFLAERGVRGFAKPKPIAHAE